MKEFEREIRILCQRHQLWRGFSDFCELSALSLVNVVEQRPEREVRYREILAAYSPEEVQVFPRLLGLTTMGLEGLDRDFLGELFMRLELGSHWHGQFFTPMSVCRMIAEISLVDANPEEIIAHKGFVSLHEPAVGAGAMVIAFAAAMQARGLNPQTSSHVTAIDIDGTAARMAFVQLALLGLPATVIIGDTLAPDFAIRETLHTPAHHLGMWRGKVRRGFTLDSPQGRAEGSWRDTDAVMVVPKQEDPPDVIPTPAAKRGTQLKLF